MQEMLNKMYKVKATKEDAAKVLIRFMNCPDLYYKEITIYNPKPKKPSFRPGYVFPDMDCKTYYDSDIPSEEELKKVLRENDYMFTAVAAVDEYDEDRITLSCMGKSAEKKLPFLKDLFSLTTYNSNVPDSEMIGEIIDYLEGN